MQPSLLSVDRHYKEGEGRGDLLQRLILVLFEHSCVTADILSCTAEQLVSSASFLASIDGVTIAGRPMLRCREKVHGNDVSDFLLMLSP